MHEETTTAVEILESVGATIYTIADNLGANRLDRRSFRKYLCDYSARAASDGQLITASRQDVQCANRALFLAYAHLELICWLANNNYTVSSTSVKWYSWRKIFSKYRLPLLGVSSQTSSLTSMLRNIGKIADQVYADLDAKNIIISPDYLKYRKVPVGPPVVPPEAIHDLIHRATIAHKQLSQ